MFNLPVKLATMVRPYQEASPQIFLDHAPLESIDRFKALLPQSVRHTVEFALSDTALLLVLEHEVEVHMARRQMIAVNAALNANSWLYTNGLTELPALEEWDATLDHMAEALWAKTASFDKVSGGLSQRLAKKQEWRTLLTLYVMKHESIWTPGVDDLSSSLGLKRFLTAVVADCVYKADAMQALFGPASTYTHLWWNKQSEFYVYLASIVPGMTHQQSA